MSEGKSSIHVKGIGQVTQTPDWVVLSLTLTAQNSDYSSALRIGSQQVEMLRESIVAAGFKADDLKTMNFVVRAIYEDEERREGSSKRYRQVFVGFECQHDLRMSFDFDNDKLNAAVDSIAKCLSEPKISLAFTVKDAESFNDKLLKSAAHDAKRKAKALCAASGVKLGKLISIDYSWDEVTVRREVCLQERAVLGCSSDAAFDFQPDDVKASDTVDFLWEIE